jgi:hypothetical protein
MTKEKNKKFLMSVEPSKFANLNDIAEKRGVRLQELFRAVIIPEWLQNNQ